MKKTLTIIAAAFFLMGLVSCGSKSSNILLYRAFPTMSWERFDFVQEKIEITKATTYDLVLNVSFDPSYAYKDLSIVFTIFDSYDNPFRTRAYKFQLKENDGSWKSILENGAYHFTFPINSELNINEPGTYVFQVENRMPITPLYGIKEISIVKN